MNIFYYVSFVASVLGALVLYFLSRKKPPEPKEVLESATEPTGIGFRKLLFLGKRLLSRIGDGKRNERLYVLRFALVLTVIGLASDLVLKKVQDHDFESKWQIATNQIENVKLATEKSAEKIDSAQTALKEEFGSLLQKLGDPSIDWDSKRKMVRQAGSKLYELDTNVINFSSLRFDWEEAKIERKVSDARFWKQRWDDGTPVMQYALKHFEQRLLEAKRKNGYSVESSFSAVPIEFPGIGAELARFKLDQGKAGEFIATVGYPGGVLSVLLVGKCPQSKIETTLEVRVPFLKVMLCWISQTGQKPVEVKDTEENFRKAIDQGVGLFLGAHSANCALP